MSQKRQTGLPTAWDAARLIVTLCTLLLFILPAVFAKLPPPVTQRMYIAAYLLWGALALDSAVFLVRMEKTERQHFLRLHKSDLLFSVITLFCLPAALLLRAPWFVLFVIVKLPGVLLPFNDEKVFQFIINLIAVLLIVLFIFPFFNVLAVSISSPNQIVNLLPKEIDLYSVKHVLSDVGFFRSMWISVIVTVIGTLLSVLSMAMAAYPLSKPHMPLRRTVMLFFIIVMLFTGGMAPSMLLMNYLRLNNTIWALIFPSVVNVFYLILLKGFFADVPDELEESARLDGASNYTILFRIIFPVAAPMVATVAFFTMISYWNNINNAILYITSNQAIYPLPMYIRNFLNKNPIEVAMSNPTLVSYWDNVKMSYVLFSIIPVILVYPFTFKYLKNGVAMGAVKG